MRVSKGEVVMSVDDGLCEGCGKRLSVRAFVSHVCDPKAVKRREQREALRERARETEEPHSLDERLLKGFQGLDGEFP